MSGVHAQLWFVCVPLSTKYAQPRHVPVVRVHLCLSLLVCLVVSQLAVQTLVLYRLGEVVGLDVVLAFHVGDAWR